MNKALRLSILLLALWAVPAAHAERLVLAVLQISGTPDPATVGAELAAADLPALAEGRGEGGLRSADVVFIGEFPAGALSQTLTYAGRRVTLDYAVRRAEVRARVVLEELEKLGFKTMSRRAYEGTGQAPAGRPVILSISQRADTTVTGSRTGNVGLRNIKRTTVLAAQLIR